MTHLHAPAPPQLAAGTFAGTQRNYTECQHLNDEDKIRVTTLFSGNSSVREQESGVEFWDGCLERECSCHLLYLPLPLHVRWTVPGAQGGDTCTHTPVSHWGTNYPISMLAVTENIYEGNIFILKLLETLLIAEAKLEMQHFSRHHWLQRSP